MSTAAWLFHCFVLLTSIFQSQPLVKAYEEGVYMLNREHRFRGKTGSGIFDSIPFPTGIALKETSLPFSSTSELEPTSTSLIGLPPSALEITSTITYTSLDKVAAYTTVLEVSDASMTATVTEIETSYLFTFDVGNVIVETESPGLQSTITLTAYEQAYVLSGVTIAPKVSYTTEYFTSTITIGPLSELQPATVVTTVTTTMTDTITVSESTQAPEVYRVITNDYYTTESSILTEISLQTEVLLTITNVDGLSVDYITVNSLVRNRPYYLDTSYIYSTYTYTTYTTTTTTAPPEPQPPQPPPPPPTEENNPTSISSSPSTRYGGDPFDYCVGMPPQMLLQCQHRM